MTREYLSARLKAGETIFSAWMSNPAKYVAQVVAQGSWDSVVVDMQHGTFDYESMLETVAIVTASGKAAIVRMPLGDEGMIGRILDSGAQGVICPMVNTGQDASRFGRETKFPPLGLRSWGPHRALDVLDFDKNDYLAEANDFCLSWAMVETETALGNIDSIMSSKAIDGVFIGPNDLCVSLTGGKMVDPGEKVVMEAVDHILRKAHAHRVIPGIFANTPELARTYSDMGFKFITVANEIAYARIGGEFLLDMIRNPDDSDGDD